MFMCRVVSCLVGKGCLLWPVCSLDIFMLVFALVHFVLQGQTYLEIPRVSRYLLTSYFCIPIPYDEKDIFFFLVLGLEGIVGLHRTGQLQLLQHQWLGHRLGLLWCWNGFALEMNRNHSVVFELAPKYSISDSLVDHAGNSVSSKGFLPTVVDGHLN